MRRLAPSRAPVRHDGWTPDRQLDFLDMLARTGSVTRAARAAGMSRESAYRLRSRQPDGLFAAAWDRALTPLTLAVAPKLMKVTGAPSPPPAWRAAPTSRDTRRTHNFVTLAAVLD